MRVMVRKTNIMILSKDVVQSFAGGNSGFWPRSISSAFRTTISTAPSIMAIGADTLILTLVGIGIIVVLGMLLIEMRSAAMAQPQREVIVERRVPWRGYGPYYSHLPLRPLVY